jgi:hypothetical protein
MAETHFMKADRARIEAAIVIKWPHSVPVAAAREVSRRLVDCRVPATWSVDQATQVTALASWGVAQMGAEAALIVSEVKGAASSGAEQEAGREMARRLDLLRSAGASVDLVQGGPELAAGHWPRTLRALGVHAVVVEGSADVGPARALPFGVWQFTPQATAPHVSRWTDWFRPRRRLMFAVRHGAPAVVTIDLARLGAAGSRPWRDMEATIAQARDLVAGGAIALLTMGQLTARFTTAHAAKPQRSILRAA